MADTNVYNIKIEWLRLIYTIFIEGGSMKLIEAVFFVVTQHKFDCKMEKEVIQFYVYKSSIILVIRIIFKKENKKED